VDEPTLLRLRQGHGGAHVEETLDTLTPGAVIVLDWADAGATATGVPAIIRQARRRGYKFVPLSIMPATSPETPPHVAS
jgi:hypothetical protein